MPNPNNTGCRPSHCAISALGHVIFFSGSRPLSHRRFCVSAALCCFPSMTNFCASAQVGFSLGTPTTSLRISGRLLPTCDSISGAGRSKLPTVCTGCAEQTHQGNPCGNARAHDAWITGRRAALSRRCARLYMPRGAAMLSAIAASH